MTIDAIRLVNFQQHEDLRIKFSPTITTLVGDNNAGKSTALRGFHWLCFNQLRGKGLINWHARQAKVQLAADNSRLSRSIGRRACYRRDSQTFLAFGRDVPDAIRDLLNLDASVNFQMQHESFYWFMLSESALARELNRIADLDQIDRALAFVATRARETNAEAKVCRARLAEARETARETAWALQARRKLNKIAAFESSIAQNRTRGARIAAVLQDVKSVSEMLANASAAKESLRIAVSVAADVQKLEERLFTTELLITTIEREQKALANMQEQKAAILKRLASVRVCQTCKQPILKGTK
jgi:hypothetical protein